MSPGRFLALYGICAVVFFALDLVWLSVATSRFYQPYLRDLLSPKPRLGVAAVFYLAFVVGVVLLAVLPGVREGAVFGALWRGALFGLLAYATYDLTNLATVAGWAWQPSVIDMAWGTVLNGVVATVGFYAARWLGV